MDSRVTAEEFGTIVGDVISGQLSTLHGFRVAIAEPQEKDKLFDWNISDERAITLSIHPICLFSTRFLRVVVERAASKIDPSRGNMADQRFEAEMEFIEGLRSCEDPPPWNDSLVSLRKAIYPVVR